MNAHGIVQWPGSLMGRKLLLWTPNIDACARALTTPMTPFFELRLQTQRRVLECFLVKTQAKDAWGILIRVNGAAAETTCAPAMLFLAPMASLLFLRIQAAPRVRMRYNAECAAGIARLEDAEIACAILVASSITGITSRLGIDPTDVVLRGMATF